MQSKADSFSAYLEAKQRIKSSAQASSCTSLVLVNVLANAEQQQMAVKDLMGVSRMSLTDFADALKSLKESGYLILSGPPDAEVARLTTLGLDVTRLARK